MRDLLRWSKNSKLLADWYNFAVELVGKTKADITSATYFGGGNHACLQKMLGTWYDSSTDRSWQVIIDALKDMDEFPVIESIKSHCLNKKQV